MIVYLEGKILKKQDDSIILLVAHVGYEVLLPLFVMKSLTEKLVGDDLALYIFYYQTERQPKPVLIGFNNEEEKEFFQKFISVDAIGPLKAVKAFHMPISEIANAIENDDVGKLSQLKGIGKRTAQKIIVTLKGKVDRFITTEINNKINKSTKKRIDENISLQVFEILTSKLGYKPSEAKSMIQEAFERNDSISTPEELFDEVYKVSV